MTVDFDTFSGIAMLTVVGTTAPPSDEEVADFWLGTDAAQTPLLKRNSGIHISYGNIKLKIRFKF